MTQKIIEWNPILEILVLSSHQRVSLTIALVNAFSDRPLVNQSEWKTCCLLSQSFLFGTLIRKIKLFRLRDSLLIYKKIIFYLFCIIHRKYTQKTIKLFLFTHNFFSFFLAKILKSRLYSLNLYERKIKFWHLIFIYCTWFLTKWLYLWTPPHWRRRLVLEKDDTKNIFCFLFLRLPDAESPHRSWLSHEWEWRSIQLFRLVWVIFISL